MLSRKLKSREAKLDLEIFSYGTASLLFCC